MIDVNVNNLKNFLSHGLFYGPISYPYYSNWGKPGSGAAEFTSTQLKRSQQRDVFKPEELSSLLHWASLHWLHSNYEEVISFTRSWIAFNLTLTPGQGKDLACIINEMSIFDNTRPEGTTFVLEYRTLRKLPLQSRNIIQTKTGERGGHNLNRRSFLFNRSSLWTAVRKGIGVVRNLI